MKLSLGIIIPTLVFSGAGNAASLDDFLNGTALGRADFSRVAFRAEGISGDTAIPAIFSPRRVFYEKFP